MDIKGRLNEIHEQILAGSRTASLDLFRQAQGPIQAFLRRRFQRLSEEESYDLATDAILIYVTDPLRCDTAKSSLWSFLCRIAKRDAIDHLRMSRRRGDLLKEVESDVEFWTSRAKDVFRGEEAIDARQIMKLYQHRLATNKAEARVLALILHEERGTGAYAQALGLDPKAPDVERIVKQAKDRMLLRLKRLRDEL